MDELTCSEMDSLADRMPTPDAPKHKRGCFFRRCFFRLLKYTGLLLLAVVLYIAVDAWPFGGVTISPKTTRIVEPLTPDGKSVDYRHALIGQMPKERTTDANGLRVVFREIDIAYIGASYFGSRERFQKDREFTYRALALDPNEKRRLSFSDMADWYRSMLDKQYPGQENDPVRGKKFREFCDACHDRNMFADKPRSEATLALVKWLEQNGPALDLVAREVRKDCFCFPVWDESGGDESLFDSFNFFPNSVMRMYARGFMVRAKYRLTQGDVAGALDDREAIIRMAFHLNNQKTNCFVHNLVALAILGIGTALPLEHFPNAVPGKEDLQRLTAFDRHHISTAKFRDLCETELWLMHDSLQRLAQGKPIPSGFLEEFFGADFGKTVFRRKLTQILLDWDEVMRHVNEKMEQELDTNSPPCEARAPQWYDWLTEKGRSRRFFGNYDPLVSSVREANHRAQCACQLSAISLAMRQYRADHGTYPPYCTADAQGKPLHSWRVLILPYLGQNELYRKIKLDEPWDSEYNRQFHNAMVPFYQCPSCIGRNSDETRIVQQWEKAKLANPNDAGLTTYSVVVGPNTCFPKPGVGIDPKNLREKDKKRNVGEMILVTERVDCVNWMNPNAEITEEIALREGVNHGLTEKNGNKPDPARPGVASNHFGCVSAVLVNGAVETLACTLDAEVFAPYVNGTPFAGRTDKN